MGWSFRYWVLTIGSLQFGDPNFGPKSYDVSIELTDLLEQSSVTNHGKASGRPTISCPVFFFCFIPLPLYLSCRLFPAQLFSVDASNPKKHWSLVSVLGDLCLPMSDLLVFRTCASLSSADIWAVTIMPSWKEAEEAGGAAEDRSNRWRFLGWNRERCKEQIGYYNWNTRTF